MIVEQERSNRLRKACVAKTEPTRKGMVDLALVATQNDSLSSMIRELQAQAQQVLCEAFDSPPKSVYEASLYLAIEAELRDGTQRMHLARVGLYAEEIARQAGLSRDRQKLLLLSSPLHDIGKLSVPESILRKPRSLDAEEWDVMKKHCDNGVQLLDEVLESSSALVPAPVSLIDLSRELILSHHERYDGRGYPHHLSGEDIPLEARILAIADVFDALTTNRPFRAALDDNQALEVMMLEQGRHFDQVLFDAFLDCFSRIRSIRRNMHPCK